jgi:dipeptidyl aminopeptidase/acylaminoacyl peptidase
VTIDDILRFERLTDVKISPDGKSILYVMMKPGPRNVLGESGTLWLLDVTTKRTRRIVLATDDATSLSSIPVQPQWSPDGRHIGYLSTRTGGPEIWLYDVRTGLQRQLTGIESVSKRRRGRTSGTIREFVFSPDGDRIAFARVSTDDEQQEQLEHLKIIALSEHPYFLSPEGVDGSYAGSAVIEVKSIVSGRSEVVTPPLIGASGLAWSPDGTQLVFMPWSDAWRAQRLANAYPTVLTVSTKELKPLVKPLVDDRSPTWSPDGKKVCYIANTFASRYPESPSLFPATRSLQTVAAVGGQPSLVSGNNIDISFELPVVWAKPNTIYAGTLSHATARVTEFSLNGGPSRLITPERFHVRGYSLSADGRRMAAIFENASTPPEIYLGDPASRRFEKLTTLGSALDSLAIGRVQIVKWRSGDNRFNVEGFLVTPPDFSPGMKYPLLVIMHGGPAGLYENAFFDVNFTFNNQTPAQLFAAAGYVVLLPNKRGDESYGVDFLTAFINHWGDDVKYDVMAGVDTLIRQGLIDPDKLGVMGGSYGGYATAWAISHSDRFKAAAINDGVINLLSYYGQAYLTNDTWMDIYFGGNPSTAQNLYLEKSPILYATQINTPTLLRYGAARFPRPVAAPLQGMELFRALHERGVPVDFLYTPTQGHGIIDEEVYREWIRRNLGWFDYWVLGKGTNPLHDSTRIQGSGAQ